MVDELLQWLGKYSAPVVGLLALAAGLLFVLKELVQKTITTQLERYAKAGTLRLERVSKFKETILLERYRLVTDLEKRIGQVMTNLNRVRHGTEVSDFVVNGDIKPLTEVYEMFVTYQYLLGQQFHPLLRAQADLAIQFANTRDVADLKRLEAEYLKLAGQFHQTMEAVFGIDQITLDSI